MMDIIDNFIMIFQLYHITIFSNFIKNVICYNGFYSNNYYE